MPEGPSIVILREAAAKFAGRRVLCVSGNSKQDIDRLHNKALKAVRSWGKHFLIQFSGFSLRVHMLMFGSYRIDERKPSPPRVSLQFDNGELNIYASSVKYIEGALEDTYDWRGDVLSPDWDPRLARRRLQPGRHRVTRHAQHVHAGRCCQRLLQRRLHRGVVDHQPQLVDAVAVAAIHFAQLALHEQPLLAGLGAGAAVDHHQQPLTSEAAQHLGRRVQAVGEAHRGCGRSLCDSRRGRRRSLH